MHYSSEVIGKKIAELRKGRNWSQERLGKELHCSGKQVSLYEAGKTTPSTDTLFMLSEIFNCQLGFLLGEPDYSEGTKIETAIHEATGLTKEAMNVIRVLTGTGRSSPCFGYKSDEYRALLNRILLTKQFSVFMEELLNLDEAFSKHESTMSGLKDKIGEERFIAAQNLSLEVEGLPTDDPGPDVSREQLDDMFLFQKAEDTMNGLTYTVKVRRYEAREAFESLLMEMYPRRLNE